MNDSHAQQEQQQQQQQQQQPQQHGRSCPCKRVPLSLSSFTAAEHGNVAALLSRQQRRQRRGSSSLPPALDSAGNTPLHLAAQHGHTAATAMLLNDEPNNSASINVNASAGGATPLHRAAFAGAVATMRLLVAVPECDLLARDTSFGDCQTPLHKAASGGRHLAVQLLLEALASRSSSSTNAQQQSRLLLLETALQSKDAAGRTPLQVARQKQSNRDEERRSVLRWDSVAGGEADWEKCTRLLERAATKTKTAIANNSPEQSSTIGATTTEPPLAAARALPKHLQPGSQQQPLDCGCADENGRCLTASWERAFQAALQTTVDQTLVVAASKNSNENDSTATRRSDAGNIENSETAVEEETIDQTQRAAAPSEDATKCESTATEQPLLQGLRCSNCDQPSIVLYPSTSDTQGQQQQQQQLICRQCRRSRRKQSQVRRRVAAAAPPAPLLQS